MKPPPTSSLPASGPKARRHGYTLLELVLAIALYSLVVSSVAMAITLVANAYGSDVQSEVIATNTVALDLSADLRFAVSFSRQEASAVEFAVPDRDGDGVDEKLSYTWSGVAGDPLLYTYNALKPRTVLENVHDFDLGYVLGEAPPLPLGESLALLKHHDDAPGGHFHDFKLEDNKWCAQYFDPDLPVGVSTWKIKRVRFMAKSEGDDLSGVFEVRITTAGPGQQPTNEILDVATVLEHELDESYTWVAVDFTKLNELDPEQGLCLVLAQVSPSGSAAKVPNNHGGSPMTPFTHWMTSGDTGASWSDPVEDRDMRFFVYGTHDLYLGEGSHQFVSAVTIRLQPGAKSDLGVDTTVRLMNPPGVLP